MSRPPARIGPLGTPGPTLGWITGPQVQGEYTPQNQAAYAAYGLPGQYYNANTGKWSNNPGNAVSPMQAMINKLIPPTRATT